MAKKKDIIEELNQFAEETFQHERLEDVMGDRFGRYSKAIIQERAIPDVRDGLKPVQRRILFGMQQLKLTSTSPYKKCAKVVGDVMGKYHPHGDSSIYEALVHMSQDWKMGVCLVDLQGNNGSIDGDGPAAYRYTECRLSKDADYMLQDIEKKTVEMIDNFDGEEKEPIVLPARFPNILVNGGMGISSGYATYIPPHNMKEVVDATIAKIDNPNLTIDELLEIMPGPDFPTGGIAMGKEGIREAFLTGSGTVVVKSKYYIEDIDSKRKRIVVTEIPFDTVKQKTVEKIEQIRIDHKIDGIDEVRDETDRQGLRISIDLKEGANTDAIIKYLFKNTNLQANIKYNMVVIHNMCPKRLGVLEILSAYIDHQKDVVTNRTNFLKAKDKHRLHIVDGLIKMVSILDDVIKTIRGSQNKQDAKDNLIAKFEFTEIQADAILAMQLYRLSNTDIVQLHNEHDTLNKNIEGYDKILSNEKNLLKVIKNELKEISDKINQPRRTQIEDVVTDLTIDESNLVIDETVMLIATRKGYLKRVTPKAYNAGSINTLGEKDAIILDEEVSTKDILLGFTNKGNFVYIPIYKIDECKLRDRGQFLNNICQIDPSEEFVNYFVIKDFTAHLNVLIASKDNLIKQCLIQEFNVSRFTKEVKCMKLAEKDCVVSIDITDNPCEIITCSTDAEVLRMRAEDVPLYGKNASGIKAQKIKEGHSLVGAVYANKNDDILLLTNRASIKRIALLDPKDKDSVFLSTRGRSGDRQIKLIKTNPVLVEDIKKLTPNQYKEQVSINVLYESANDYINSFDLKYSQPDTGTNIQKDGFGEPLKIFVNKPKKRDDHVSDDYLINTKDLDTTFDYFDSIDDKPLKATKSNNVFDELDKILELESKEINKNTLVDIDENNNFQIDNNEPKEIKEKQSDIKEIIETEKNTITRTKSTTIVRKKPTKIDFFDDNN